MDISKLPKLSDTRSATDAPPAAEAVSEPTPVPAAERAVERGPMRQRDSVPYRSAYDAGPPGLGPEIWVSVVIGVIFVALGLGFAKWGVAKVAGRPFDTGVNWVTEDARNGSPVPYFQLLGHTAWQEAGEFFFGLTLLVEAATKAAVVLRPGRGTRGLLMAAFALTGFTLLLNLAAAGLILVDGLIPVLSLLAVAFGGWVLSDVWRALAATSPRRVASGG